jgi:hypothetical protein
MIEPRGTIKEQQQQEQQHHQQSGRENTLQSRTKIKNMLLLFFLFSFTCTAENKHILFLLLTASLPK